MAETDITTLSIELIGHRGIPPDPKKLSTLAAVIWMAVSWRAETLNVVRRHTLCCPFEQLHDSGAFIELVQCDGL